jgi:photosystem II stability/assembly factor-like uncharacterized protein
MNRLILCALLFTVAGQAAAGSPLIQKEILARDGAMVVDRIPKSDATPSAAPASREAAASAGASAAGFPWVLQLQNAGVYTDLSMVDATHGFASAELGQVYRTTDGGTWTSVMNIGFPRYWYGVHTFSPDTAIVTGFQNQSGEGIARWTTNAGLTWSADIVIDPAHWLTTNQFADRQHGVATAIGSGLTYTTSNGGGTAADWTQILADPTQGWFAGNFTFLPAGLRVYVTGITFCTSTNGGLTYDQRSSIDPVFDGGVSFPDPMHGWTGGGQISAPVQGWVHRTTDGGTTWSGRILNPPYPIRSLLFLDDQLGFAVGGNYFQSIGGIWSTIDGGVSWNLDINTGCEMKGLDWARVDNDSVAVWSAGSNSAVGRIYRTKVHFPAGTTGIGDSAESPAAGLTLEASPNPFRDQAEIRLTGNAGHGATIHIVDAAGRTVRKLAAAEGATIWDGRDDRGQHVAAGVYYATIAGGVHASAPIALVRLP